MQNQAQKWQTRTGVPGSHFRRPALRCHSLSVANSETPALTLCNAARSPPKPGVKRPNSELPPQLGNASPNPEGNPTPALPPGWRKSRDPAAHPNPSPASSRSPWLETSSFNSSQARASYSAVTSIPQSSDARSNKAHTLAFHTFITVWQGALLIVRKTGSDPTPGQGLGLGNP